MNEKKCGKCQASQPITEFWRDSSRPDGFCWECKTCRKPRQKAYFAEYYKLHAALIIERSIRNQKQRNRGTLNDGT